MGRVAGWGWIDGGLARARETAGSVRRKHRTMPSPPAVRTPSWSGRIWETPSEAKSAAASRREEFLRSGAAATRDADEPSRAARAWRSP